MTSESFHPTVSSLVAQLQRVRDLQVRLDEPLSAHTSFRIGGPADVLCIPCSVRALQAALTIVGEHDAPLSVIGSGTNLLVRDGGVRGVTLKIDAHLGGIEYAGTRVGADAGAGLGAVATFAAERGLSGLEFAAGIPGSIGGAVVMNAGAHGGEMADVVERVEAFNRLGEPREYERDELRFGYRHSVLAESDDVVGRVWLRLSPGEPEDIRRRMADLARRRREAQPLELPSAGSVFKRPPGDYAGRLIEAAGLKGYAVGRAQVSEKHAGFIVNLGGATARDVLALVEQVRETVRRQFGVELEPEVRVIGED
ncbi:MAG: UDP-N-acetylmuramate dehydrogenase [Armatimonadota bacterium]